MKISSIDEFDKKYFWHEYLSRLPPDEKAKEIAKKCIKEIEEKFKEKLNGLLYNRTKRTT